MRRRVSCLRFMALATALLAGGAPARSEPVAVAASQIDRFDVRTPIGAPYGKLVFLGGLQLRSDEPSFGGLSGLRVSPDGSAFTAISDRGMWFRGTLDYAGAQLSGVSDVARQTTPGRDGLPLPGRPGFDTEALEIEGRTAWVSAEGVHWLTRYTLGVDGFPSGKGVAVALPKAMAGAPRNSGYEAMAALSSGALVMIAEKHLDEAGNDRAWVVGGKTPVAFSVAREDDFSPTDLARLPSGDLLMLERRYRPPFSLAVRIKRLAAKDIRAGAVVGGETLMEATLSQAIDNFEAIAVHRGAGGATVITVLSDDNFNTLQRTLLMQFALPD